MTTIREVAPAKLNLALHVRARRADGYHELETLFAFCADGDAITIEPAAADAFTVTGPFAAALDGEGDNLVTRAATAFRAVFGGGACRITLDKHLPVASGIGGGSADAAATLRGLARLNGVDPADPALIAVARRLGADVPACLLGRTAFGRGRGDDLVPVAGLGDAPALLVNPGVPVSTAAVFARWDGADRGALNGAADSDGTLARALAGRNDLQAPAVALAPAIGEVLARLRAAPGVRLVRMSGSGATCFALFDDASARDEAAREIARERPDWWSLATAVA